MWHFRPVFLNLDKPEAADDVISGAALEYAGTDLLASFADYRLNSGRTIRLFVRPHLFSALLYSI